MKKSIFLAVVLFGIALFLGGQARELKLEKAVEIGAGSLTLENTYAVCEDGEENFYILDTRAFKVHKFDPTGKLLLSFGGKGEGPGEFRRPYRVYCPQGDDKGVVVTEVENYFSEFDGKGALVRKVNLLSSIGYTLVLKYAGGDLFSALKMPEEGDSRLILVTGDGKTVNKSLLTSPPNYATLELNGQKLRYTLTRSEFSPTLVFDYYDGRSCAGMTRNYEILVLDGNGKVTAKIKRDTPQPTFTAKEKEFLKESINAMSRTPEPARRDAIKKIPEVKNFFYDVKISDRFVFVFRVGVDVSKENAPVPADVYTLDGKSYGSVEFPAGETVLRITHKYVYTRKTDADDNLLVTKYKYSLK